MITNKLNTFKEELSQLFDILSIKEKETKDMLHTKYWDLDPSINKDFIIRI